MIIFLSSPASAQHIPGKVFDSASRQPLPLVTIHVMKSDLTPVKTILSDSSGSFAIALDTGKYFILYTCAGYRPFQSLEITVRTGQSIELSPVFLNRDAGQLASVTVLGRKPVIEPAADGFVYNAEHDAAIAAGSAVDVLRKIPMVTVAPDGSPRIRGSSNIRVFIDNKPSSVFATSVAEALQQVPSEEIARVEIITHPSAKYDAEGTDAVINIITRKIKYNGFNGMVRSYIGNWQQDFSTTLKMRSGYWMGNFEGGFNFSTNESGYTLLRTPNRHETSNRLYQQRESEWKQNVQFAALNVIRIIDSLHTINAGYRFRNMSARETAEQQVQLYAEDTISTAFTREVPGGYTNRIHTFTAGYTGQTRNKKNEFSLLAAFFKHSGTDEYNLRQLRNQVVDYREKSDGEISNAEFSMQADIIRRFSPTSRLETGIKATSRNTTTESIIDIFNVVQNKFLRDPIRTNTFHYDRGIYAAYASYIASVKKWQFRTGLRFEQTKLNAHFKDTALQIPDFKNLLPNLLLKRTFSENSALAYSYTTRIIRPFIYYLNPNKNYVDSLNISYGNPGLMPEIVHNHTMEFSYNKRSVFSGITLTYNRSRRGIEEVRLLRSDKIAETTYRNIGHGEIWGLSTSLRYSNTKITAGYTVLLRHISLTSPALHLTASGFTGQININTAYRFKKGFSLESFVYVESGSINLQQSRTWYLFYNLLATKKLLKDKISVTIRMDGFLDPWFYRTTRINTPTLFQETTYRSISRYLRVAFSWKFGKQDLRTPVSRTIENND